MILRITDLSGTCNLVWHNRDNRSYQLARDGWAPAIAARRRGQLGGRSRYTDVDEELELNVYGASQVEVLQNLEKLARLLDQAERWADEEPGVAPVYIQYTPTGGRFLSSAVILGRNERDDSSGVGFPMTFNSGMNAFMVAGLRLRFRRSGLWLRPAETKTGTTAANATTITATFTEAATVESPMQVKVTANDEIIGESYDGFVVVTNNSADIQVIEAETMVAGNYTSFADASTFARGNTVLRFTPTSTSITDLAAQASTLLTANTWRAIDLFAIVRSSTATGWRMRSIIYNGSNGGATTTPERAITATAGLVQQIYIGRAYSVNGFDSFTIQATPLSLTGSPKLDIDYFVAVNAGNPLLRVIGTQSNVVTDNGFVIDSRAMSATSPLMYEPGFSGEFIPLEQYSGDVYPTMTGTTVAVLPFTSAQQDLNVWRPRGTFTGVVIQHTLTVTRYLASLTPQ